MCEYCEKPNKTILAHRTGAEAFVGAGCLWLRFYDKQHDNTIVNFTDINYCPMCGHKLAEADK